MTDPIEEGWYEAYERGVSAGVRGDSFIPEDIEEDDVLLDIWKDGYEEGKNRDVFYEKQRDLHL